MSHELPPKQREQALQFNKFILDNYVPVLRDIASAGNINQESTDGCDKYLSVVLANGDYYSVGVTDITQYVPGKGGPHTEIEIMRLLEQADGTPYETLRQYSYDSIFSTRVITTRTAKVDEDKPGNSLGISSVDDPKETLLLFGQFATITDTGDVAQTCEIIDAGPATELLYKHEKEKEKLFRKIELLKKHRSPRLKKPLLDRIMGENGNSWNWK